MERNQATTARTDLENLLQLLADLNEELELFALGGTAMVLKGIKESTKDVDFLTTAEYPHLRKLLLLAGLREESPSLLCNVWYLDTLRIDIFYHSFILGYTLPEDWKELSEHVRTIGKLKLYILNWLDIIITKIARSETRDIDDCLAIIKSQRLDFNKLTERYYQHAETAIISEYDAKFKHLEYRWSKQ